MELETIKDWAKDWNPIIGIIGVIVSIAILAGIPKKCWDWRKRKSEVKRWAKGQRAKVANKMKEVGERSLKLAAEVKEEAREIGAEENHNDPWALVFCNMTAADMKWELEAIAWLAQEVGELTADTGEWLARTKRTKRKDVERRLSKVLSSWAAVPLVKMTESAARASISSVLEKEKVDEEMAATIKDEAGNIFMNVSAEHSEKSVEKVKQLLEEVGIGNHVLWQAKRARAASKSRRVLDTLREINKVGNEVHQQMCGL